AALATMLAAVALATGRPSEWLIDTLSSRRTGAQVTRWLLPAALVVPIAVGWMRLYAEREGLFGEAFGMTLFTLVMIAWFSSLIIWVARTLDRAAAQRAQAEGAATPEHYTELAQRVVRRTAALERASAALRERNALLNAITTSTPDLISAKDRQGRLLMANPAWSKAVGKNAEEAMTLDENERVV